MVQVRVAGKCFNADYLVVTKGNAAITAILIFNLPNDGIARVKTKVRWEDWRAAMRYEKPIDLGPELPPAQPV